jgi:hypothetical protein
MSSAGIIGSTYDGPGSAAPWRASRANTSRLWRSTEGTYRFKLGVHDFGLVIGPNTFEPTLEPPDEPTATIDVDSITATHMFNGGLTVSEAEAMAKLRISGDRGAALALLDRLSLSPLRL